MKFKFTSNTNFNNFIGKECRVMTESYVDKQYNVYNPDNIGQFFAQLISNQINGRPIVKNVKKERLVIVFDSGDYITTSHICDVDETTDTVTYKTANSVYQFTF